MAVVPFAKSKLRRDIEARNPEVTKSLRQFEQSKLGQIIIRSRDVPRTLSAGGGGSNTIRKVSQAQEAIQQKSSLLLKEERLARKKMQEAKTRAQIQERKSAETRVRQAQEEQGRLGRLSLTLQQRREAIRKEIAKEKPRIKIRPREIIQQEKKELKLFGVTVAGTVIQNIIAWKDLPKTAKAIVQNPSILKSIPSAIKRDTIDFGRLIKVSPTEAIAKIGTELFLLKGTSLAFSKVGKLTGLASARVSPKFVGKAKLGKSLQVTTKAGKKVNLKVVGRIGSASLPRETIKKQVGRAGRRALPVSAQSDELVGFIKTKRIIRKPILNEAKFTKPTKRLLSKFDEGRITKKQITKLDKLIKKQSGSGLLERSFFVDPKGRIRPSRIGVEKEASIIDIIKGDVTFRKKKPQILVFDKVRVEKFPKGLKNVKRKLATGKTLTKSETDKLLQFQLKTSGKFKPLGFVSKEAELTLAPGELVQKVKKVGVTIVNGKKVPIIEAKVLKPTGKLKKAIDLAKKGKLTKKQLKSLDKTLKKKTGFNFGVSRPKKAVKRVSIKRIGATTISRAPKRKPRISRIPIRPRRISRAKRISRKPSRPSKPSKARRPARQRRPIKPSRPSRPVRKARRPARPGRPGRPSKPGRPARPGRPGKPVKVAKIKIKKRKKISKAKKKIGYDVFGKKLVGKKKKVAWVKLNTKPLSKRDALNRGSFAVDHSTARTFRIKRIGKVKKIGKITRREGKHFTRSKRKFRTFKIRKGRRVPIKRKFIERKGKALIDTSGEKRGLKLSRIAKQLRTGRPIRKITRKKIKRKASQAQLQALAKGRAKLKRMRRK